MNRMKLFFLTLSAVLFLLSQFANADDTIKVLMLAHPNDQAPSDNAEHVEDISGKIFIKGKFYEGTLRILKDERGLHVINTIPFDNFVEMEVAAEIEKEWELEALKAQAVISRTYALFHKNHNAGKSYHIASSILHKMYDNNVDPLVTYAVKATRHEILTYDNYPIKALYHETCEGKTELPEEVWHESYPYLKSVNCNSKNAPYESWQRKFTLNELSKALETGNVINIDITSHTATGRVKTLRLVLDEATSGSSFVEISALEFRNRLGLKELPSTSFTVSKQNNTIFFNGNGNGHGVGLSKWGALEMARQGKNYREILSHYYPGTTIHNNEKLHHLKFVSKE